MCLTEMGNKFLTCTFAGFEQKMISKTVERHPSAKKINVKINKA